MTRTKQDIAKQNEQLTLRPGDVMRFGAEGASVTRCSSARADYALVARHFGSEHVDATAVSIGEDASNAKRTMRVARIAIGMLVGLAVAALIVFAVVFALHSPSTPPSPSAPPSMPMPRSPPSPATPPSPPTHPSPSPPLSSGILYEARDVTECEVASLSVAPSSAFSMELKLRLAAATPVGSAVVGCVGAAHHRVCATEVHAGAARGIVVGDGGGDGVVAWFTATGGISSKAVPLSGVPADVHLVVSHDTHAGSLNVHSAGATILGSSPVSVSGATAISTPVSVGCSSELDENGFLGEARLLRLWGRVVDSRQVLGGQSSVS